jgi:beta-galactosidase
LITEVRTDSLFDNDWLFFRGDTNAEAAAFNDSDWRLLDLPHDWSIENIPGTDSPFDSAAAGGLDAGYLVGGTGWYRKKFTLPENISGRRFQLFFEGIYMNSDVWLNGQHLGNHPYGYTSFRYDITGILQAGRENVISVRVRNEGHNSRWYTGSGIYRHVHLIITDPVHLDPWWLSLTTVGSEKEASVHVSATVFNESVRAEDVALVTHILDKAGHEVATSETKGNAASGGSVEIRHDLKISPPELWSTESPSLYKAVNEVYSLSNGKRTLRDRVTNDFGIRSVKITAKEGFKLNGLPLLLKGGCMHHDNGPLGAAAFDRAEERRVELMKASGFNAIRCAHNPPSQAFLDACDRLGMLVIDESFDMWAEAKNPDDYHLYFSDWWQKDVESMIRRDRNHPSVVLWSIGNEIPERGKPEGVKLAKMQYDFIKTIDSSRMITSAVNSIGPDKDPYFAVLDVCGYNYAVDKYVPDHNRLPGRIIVSTESFPLEAFEYWMGVVDHPWVIGDFVWTGFDYLGEASIGWLGYPHDKSFYPWNQAYCGDIDICGFKRPQSYYRDILWGSGKQIAVFVRPPVPTFPLNPEKAEWSKWEWKDDVAAWNWDGYEGKKMTVVVYSSYPETELFLNDKSLGKKKTGRSEKWTATYDVAYQPGVLRAQAYDNKGGVISSELKTAGPPVELRLTPDRDSIDSGGQDLSFVTVELLDSGGVRNPFADDQIEFEIEGPGIIQAVGSSNPMSLESFTSPGRKAYQGRCLVIVRSDNAPGDIVLRASCESAGSSEITIKSF